MRDSDLLVWIMEPWNNGGLDINDQVRHIVTIITLWIQAFNDRFECLRMFIITRSSTFPFRLYLRVWHVQRSHETHSR